MSEQVNPAEQQTPAAMDPKALARELIAQIKADQLAQQRAAEERFARTRAAAAHQATPGEIPTSKAGEPAPIDRRLADTEEGRMQRYAFLAILVAAVLAFGLQWLGMDPTPAYGLMTAASAALFANAGLGAARQLAKGKAVQKDSA